jgi:hypothetical protein
MLCVSAGEKMAGLPLTPLQLAFRVPDVWIDSVVYSVAGGVVGEAREVVVAVSGFAETAFHGAAGVGAVDHSAFSGFYCASKRGMGRISARASKMRRRGCGGPRNGTYRKTRVQPSFENRKGRRPKYF